MKNRNLFRRIITIQSMMISICRVARWDGSWKIEVSLYRVNQVPEIRKTWIYDHGKLRFLG